MDDDVQKQIIMLSTLKIKPYRKFIKKLLKIEEKGLVSEKNYRKLVALFREQIMLYLNKKNAKIIAANLICIGSFVGVGGKDCTFNKELRKPVIKIINNLMQNMGFGGKLDGTIIEKLEKAEDVLFPKLFKQAIKEALDNVLVKYSDYCLLNRGEYVHEEDGEYIVFPFINNHPFGCKIKIGPFTNKADTDIVFKLYVPRYVQKYIYNIRDDSELSNNIKVHIDDRELPLSVSIPLTDSCLIELEQEDCYNAKIPSFSFDDQISLAPFRHDYAEAAFALGQRAKYIFIHAIVPDDGMYLHDYIANLEKIENYGLYPGQPWKLSDSGDLELISDPDKKFEKFFGYKTDSNTE
jgi:hypothetical protein